MSGIIKNVEQVSVVIPAGQTSASTDLSTVVDSSYASEHINGEGTTALTSNDCTKSEINFVLSSDGTKVTCTRNTADSSNAITIKGCVIWWTTAAIKSIVRGSIVLSAGATSANSSSYSAITTTNAVIQHNGATFDTATYNGSTAKAALTFSSTQATASRGASTGNLTAYFTLIEFNSGILNSDTQQISQAMGSAVATKTTAITSVNTAQTILIWGGFKTNTGGGNNFPSNRPYAELTNPTTVTFKRAVGNTVNPTINVGVLEFKSADVNSLNRDTIVISTSSSSNTSSSFTAVDETACFLNWLGSTGGGTSYDPATQNTNLVFSSTTQTQLSTNSNTSSAVTGSWEAIEFIKSSSSSSGSMFLVM